MRPDTCIRVYKRPTCVFWLPPWPVVAYPISVLEVSGSISELDQIMCDLKRLVSEFEWFFLCITCINLEKKSKYPINQASSHSTCSAPFEAKRRCGLDVWNKSYFWGLPTTFIIQWLFTSGCTVKPSNIHLYV